MHPTKDKPKGIAARAGRWSANHRTIAILGWFALVIAALTIGGSVGTKELADSDSGSGEAARADRALDKAPGFEEQASESVLIQHKKLTVNDPRFQSVVNDVVRGLERDKAVAEVTSPLKDASLVSKDRLSVLVDMDYRGDPDVAEDKVEPLLKTIDDVPAEHPGFYAEMFGSGSFDKEIGGAFEKDLEKSEKLSLGVTLAILLFAFGALVAASIPLILAASAIAMSMGLVAIASHVFPVDEAATNVLVLIGAAVAVDYSLFYMRREREERANGADPKQALETASRTSGRAVLVSGLTVLIAMAGMFFSGDKTFIGFGIATMIVVAAAMIGSLTVLPAIIATFRDRAYSVRVPWLGKHRKNADTSRVWGAVVGGAMKRPIVAVIVAGGLLVALTVPAFSLETKVPGVADLPQGFTSLQAYERTQKAFPGEVTPASVVIQADNVRSEDVTDAVDALTSQALASGFFTGTPELKYSTDDKLVNLDLPMAGDGYDSKSTAALEKLRNDLIPATINQVPGTTTNVTGDTAGNQDFNDTLASHMPLVFAFVLGFAFLLLLYTFRSLVIPIKAILLNLLSVGAAYGLLVLVFQQGHGVELIGGQQMDGITSWLPLFMFVVLFGLSMDYHVFILSRVREGWERGLSTDKAVEYGIKSTAGVVTSAAIVMVGVFGVFITLSMTEFKQMGLGLAAAILIDATIVRAVLLPATMKLLGDWNWYLPRFLDWLPQSRHHESLKPLDTAVPAGARA